MPALCLTPVAMDEYVVEGRIQGIQAPGCIFLYHEQRSDLAWELSVNGTPRFSVRT